METLQAISGRRVVRSFARRAVEPKLLESIVRAGRHAMSARNLQPWQFIVIRDAARLREIGGLCTTGRFVADAPAAVAVLKDTSNARWADVELCASRAEHGDRRLESRSGDLLGRQLRRSEVSPTA